MNLLQNVIGGTKFGKFVAIVKLMLWNYFIVLHGYSYVFFVVAKKAMEDSYEILLVNYYMHIASWSTAPHSVYCNCTEYVV